MAPQLNSHIADLLRRLRLRNPESARGIQIPDPSGSILTAINPKTEKSFVVLIKPVPVISAEDFYQEGKDRVVLRSTEGKVFHVDFKHLMAHSAVFHDMMEAANPGKEPIDIDANTHDLLHFLELLHARPFNAVLSFPSIDDILRLADMYECASVLRAVIKELSKHNLKSPWKVFRYAANLNNPDLAKKSVMQLWRKKPKLRTLKAKRITTKLIEGIPLNYATALIRAIGGRPPIEWKTRDKGIVRWYRISMAFNVK